MRPHAPALGAHAGPHQLRYPFARMDPDALPEPQPVLEPIPNIVPDIVLHRGDVLVVDPFSHGRYEYRLFDAYQRHYATLVGDHNSDGHFVIDTIRYVADRGRGLLPVRPQPEPDPYGLTVFRTPLPEHLPVRQFITDRYAADGSLVSGSTITHEHAHTHADPAHIPRDAPAHAHEHTHTGPQVARAGAPGHADDLHVHAHDAD